MCHEAESEAQTKHARKGEKKKKKISVKQIR